MNGRWLGGATATVICVTIGGGQARAQAPGTTAGNTPAAVTPASPAPRVAPVTERTMYVIRAGKDTFAIERVERTADSLSGEIDVRGADGLVYAAALGPAAAVEDIEFSVRRAAATPRRHRRAFARSVAFESGFDAGFDARFEDAHPDAPARLRETALVTGVIPYLNPSLALLEQVVRRARAVGGDSTTVPMFLMPKGEVMQASVRRVGADSAVVNVGGVTLRLHVDSIGRILGGSRADQGTIIERRPWTEQRLQRAMYVRQARLELSRNYRVESDETTGASLSTAAARSLYESAASTRNGLAR